MPTLNRDPQYRSMILTEFLHKLIFNKKKATNFTIQYCLNQYLTIRITHYKKKEAIVGLQPKANTRLVNNNGDLEFNYPLRNSRI